MEDYNVVVIFTVEAESEEDSREESSNAYGFFGSSTLPLYSIWFPMFGIWIEGTPNELLYA